MKTKNPFLETETGEDEPINPFFNPEAYEARMKELEPDTDLPSRRILTLPKKVKK